MNFESVKSLFILFSGEEESDVSDPIVSLAVAETEQMLLPESDASDIRLCFLAASIANLRLQQIKAARDRSQVTYGGKMLADSSADYAVYAERLVRDYIQLCGELIRPRTFIFSSFSGGEEDI